ncbi:unnamed protein product, partial [Prorocentrum cordatum]
GGLMVVAPVRARVQNVGVGPDTVPPRAAPAWPRADSTRCHHSRGARPVRWAPQEAAGGSPMLALRAARATEPFAGQLPCWALGAAVATGGAWRGTSAGVGGRRHMRAQGSAPAGPQMQQLTLVDGHACLHQARPAGGVRGRAVPR